jgi:hypothetical protein
VSTPKPKPKEFIHFDLEVAVRPSNHTDNQPVTPATLAEDISTALDEWDGIRAQGHVVSCVPAETPVTQRMTLDDWLDAVTVHDPDGRKDTPNPKNWPKDWWGVSAADQGGILAYFANETDAYRFRLDYINHRMNP